MLWWSVPIFDLTWKQISVAADKHESTVERFMFSTGSPRIETMLDILAVLGFEVAIIDRESGERVNLAKFSDKPVPRRRKTRGYRKAQPADYKFRIVR